MPDDERTRRRLGDETKGRIADLASGWTVDPEPAPAPEPPAPPARKKQRTVPPPPPGSAARRALEDAIVESAETPAPRRPTPAPSAGSNESSVPSLASGPAKSGGVVARSNDDSSIPSLSNSGRVMRAHRPSQVKSGPSETGTVDVSGLISEKTQPPERIVPPPTVDASALIPTAALVDKSGVAPRPSPHGTPTRPPPKVPPRATGSDLDIDDDDDDGIEIDFGSPVEAAPAWASEVRSGGVARRSNDDPRGKVGSASGRTAALNDASADASAATDVYARRAPASDPQRGKVGSTSGSTAAIPSGRVGAASGPSNAIPSDRMGGASGRVGAASGGVSAIRDASPSGRTKSISERLPLPADRAEVPPPPLPPPPPARQPRAALVVDEPLETIPDDGPLGLRLAVPRGEFDSHSGSEESKIRRNYEESTAVRDPTNALLGIAERGDPTRVGGADATEIHVPSDRATPAGRLRTQAMLRRKRGIGGDLRYVVTVLLGLRRTRRELAALEQTQNTRQQGRRRHLVTLGRVAALADNFSHAALSKARDQLAAVEDERSRHTGSVAAADAELTRVRRDREERAKQYAADITALEGELAEIAKKLAPLEKQTASAARRAADLREALQRIDAKIAATEASMSAVKTQDQDRAAIQAEIVALKADRTSVRRDEPVIASELDGLNPRIASLEAARIEARARRAELDKDESDDQRRSEELLAAIGAKRKVVDRAAGDAETMRDKILFELGERLYVDRPSDFTYELGPIDAIDVELGTGDRRMMELKEILASVDRWKLARGVALLILIVGALGTLAWWFLYGMA